MLSLSMKLPVRHSLSDPWLEIISSLFVDHWEIPLYSFSEVVQTGTQKISRTENL